MSDLREGLTRNSLEGLILPILSIDEYESKISDKRAIVVGFFVSDEAPSNDLSNFIDRSSHPILDTEVSPAPTPEGYFMVFVEVQRDDKFPKTLLDLIGEVNNLSDIESWTFQCPEHHDPIDLTEENIKKHIILDQHDVLELPDEDETLVVHDVPEPKIEKNEDPILETVRFWQAAVVDSISMAGNDVSLIRYGKETKLRVLGENFNISKIDTDHEDARWLQALLGPAYAVYGTDFGLLIEDGYDQVFVKIVN